MRHIDKTSECTEFEVYKQANAVALQTWRDFRDTYIKLCLHQHLWKEQKGLCVYCQQEIPQKVQIDSQGNIHPSHIEHIRPKSVFAHLTFLHQNLSISCEGFDIQNPPTPISKAFCGHLKDNNYDEALFLHPFEVADVERYFSYNIQGKIESSGREDSKANYMIQLLHLDNTILEDMRSEQYLLVIEEVTNNNLDIVEYLDIHYTQLPAFHSMLKQLFFI